MSFDRARKLARRLTGTEATVRNLADQLRAERELLQVHCDRVGARNLAELEGLNRAFDRLADSRTCERSVLDEVASMQECIEGTIKQLERSVATDRSAAEQVAALGKQVETWLGWLRQSQDRVDAERLERCAVFCVGSARSGTTILMHCLNHAPDMCIISECNSFRHDAGRDFRLAFNDRMLDVKKPRYRGTWLPDLGVKSSDPHSYYLALARSYTRVGEKVAFGPVPKVGAHMEAYLGWQSRFFLRSTYLCTMREPRACVWSMCKMFPQVDRRLICRTWLLAAALVIDLYRVFPNVYVILNECFSVKTIDRIGTVLGVEFNLPEDMITSSLVTSSIGRTLPSTLRGIEPELEELIEVYVQLRRCFLSETLQADRSKFLTPVLDALRLRIEDSLKRIDERDQDGRVGSSEQLKP